MFSNFVQNLYGLGARRIGVTSLPPLGCLPAARTLFGFQQPGCVSGSTTMLKDSTRRSTQLYQTSKNNSRSLKLLSLISSNRSMTLFSLLQVMVLRKQVEVAVGQGRWRQHRCCAIPIHRGLVAILHNMCFGTVSIRLRLLTMFLPIL